MKRLHWIFAVIAGLCLMVTGCAKDGAAASKANPSASAPLPGAGDKSVVDVDLTQLSGIMIYSEVYNMMSAPDQYLGKTIRMKGEYYPVYLEETGQTYHHVVVMDATGCCPEGLEFLWEGEHAYPDDYPQEYAQIEVTGQFVSYEEDGVAYYRILAPALTW